MDKAQALHNFWSSFDIPAYDENSVPDNATMPYITYEVSTGSFENEQLLTASLWYRSSSWRDITAKSEEIAHKIYSLRGSAIPIDNGYLRLWEGGSPLFQRMSEPSDDMVKRLVINLQAEFMTAY